MVISMSSVAAQPLNITALPFLPIGVIIRIRRIGLAARDYGGLFVIYSETTTDGIARCLASHMSTDIRAIPRKIMLSCLAGATIELRTLVADIVA